MVTYIAGGLVESSEREPDRGTVYLGEGRREKIDIDTVLFSRINAAGRAIMSKCHRCSKRRWRQQISAAAAADRPTRCIQHA